MLPCDIKEVKSKKKSHLANPLLNNICVYFIHARNEHASSALEAAIGYRNCNTAAAIA